MASRLNGKNKDQVVTVAELIRQRSNKKVETEEDVPVCSTEKNNINIQQEDDIMDAISKLEAKLKDFESDDEESSECSSGYDDRNGQQESVLCLSTTLKDEQIECLPDALLPKTKKRKLKGIDVEIDKTGMKSSKKKTTKNNNPSDISEVSEEVKTAVKKILGNYKPRSAERLPFYCRFCAMQCNSESEFFAHKDTVFHKAAIEMESKASYCKLCRKQLTSPAQLKEHLQSKPHKQRLDVMKSRQRPR